MKEAAHDPFAVVPFAERLRAYLDLLVSSSGGALALVELDSLGRRLGLRVRCATSAEPGHEALPAALCRALVGAGAQPTVLPAEPALAALGEGFAARGARVYPLAVTPALDQHPDAFLCVEGAGTVAPEALARLTAALSTDRAERLARTVFAAMENAFDPLELTDEEVRLFYVNPAWERFTGYTRAESVVRTLRFLRDPDAPRHDPQFYKYSEDVVNRGESWHSVLGSRRKDGVALTAEIAVKGFDAGAEGFRGNVSQRRDLRHRATRDEAMVLTHLEFRRVLGALPLALALLREGQVFFGNAPLFALLGREAEAVLAVPLGDFLHPEDRGGLAEGYVQGASGLRVLRPDGSVRVADLTGVGLVSFEGHPARIVLLKDVTDRRLDDARDAHAARLAALGSLAASVAHEVNNPLAFVTSNLESLVEGVCGDAQVAAQDALDGARRIRDIVAELHAFSRFDEPSARVEPVELSRAVRVALKICANELRHLARVSSTVPDGLYALGTEGPLVQVLVNLLVNAAQAMRRVPRRGHALSVSAEALDDRVRVVVRDTGTGIEAVNLTRIFEPFATTRGREGGYGPRAVGLAAHRRGPGRHDLRAERGGHEHRDDRDPAPGDAAAPRAVGAGGPRAHAPPRQGADRRRRGRGAPCPPSAPLRVRGHRRGLERRGARHAPGAEPRAGAVRHDDARHDRRRLYHAVVDERPTLADAFVFMTGGSFDPQATAFLEACALPVLAKPFTAASLRTTVEEVLARRRRVAG